MNSNTLGSIQAVSLTNPQVETAFATAPGGKSRGLIGLLATLYLDNAAAVPSVAPYSVFNCRPFKVRACLRVISGATDTFEAKIYFHSGSNSDLLTFSGDTALYDSTAVASSTTGTTVLLELKCFWDSQSQALYAVQNLGLVAGQLISGVSVLANSGTAITVTGTQALQFFVTGIFGGNHTANVATLVEFSIEEV